MLDFAHTDAACFLSVFPDKTARACIADGTLSAKIAQELTYEKEAATEGEPDFLKAFKDSGIWTVCI